MDLANILGQNILFATAHPDDESFLAAGLMHANHQAGGHNFLICATLGEKGRAHLDSHIEEAALKEVRRKELEKAARILQLRHSEVLDLGDGELIHKCKDFESSVKEQIERHGIQVVVGFSEDGYTGHADHKAAFQAASLAAKSYSLPYLGFAFPSLEMGAQYLAHLCRKRSHDKYHDHEDFAVGDIQVAVNPGQKLKALECYQSQWKGLDPRRIFSEELAMHFLQFEYFSLIK